MTGDYWQGSCIVANNLNASSVPNLVRISLPSEGIWGFPLLGNQFASSLGFTNRLQMVATFAPRQNIDQSNSISKMTIALASDMIATHLLGSAYAFATTVMQLDAFNYSESYQKDMSFELQQKELRFQSIIKILESYDPLYSSEIELLTQIWRDKKVKTRSSDALINSTDANI